MKQVLCCALMGLLASGVGTAMADEGMWTLDHLPITQMQQRYGFTPSQQWIDLVQHAALRLAEGCSGRRSRKMSPSAPTSNSISLSRSPMSRRK